MNIANQLKRLGRLDEAAAAHRKVIAVREQQAPDSPDLGASYSNLADVLQEQNKPDEAQALYERALVLLEKTLGPAHPNVAIVSLNLCGLLHEKSQWDAALAHCARSLSIMQAKAPTHPLIADIYSLEAECELNRDNLKAAEQLLAKSLAQCDGVTCKPQYESARLTVQARLMWANTRDRAKTLALVKQAREGFSAGSAHDSAALDAWVAKEKLER
jgi:tetratricopeptide (TPR) repeat protein